MSSILLQLRKHFNDPLFVPGQHGMIPTARTHELIQSIKRILNEVNAHLQHTSPHIKIVIMSLHHRRHIQSSLVIALGIRSKFCPKAIADGAIVSHARKSLASI